MRLICLAFIVLLALVLPASADIYQTTASDGSIVYSNTPERKSVAVIKEERTNRKPVNRYMDLSHNYAPRNNVYQDDSQQSRRIEKPRNSARHTQRSSSYHSVVEEKSRKHNVDPKLVKAVIDAESAWNPVAVSPKGAVGMMQLMPKTASDMGVNNRYDPEQNIEGGIKYLRYLLDKFNGNMTLALAAYNAGPARVEKKGGVPYIPETVNYVNKILRTYSGASYSRMLPGGDSGKIRMVMLNDGTVLYTNSYSSSGTNTRSF